jgi:HSP20 family protein
MANITRYNPFRDLIARDWPVRDLFDDWPKDLLPARFFDRDLDIGIKLDVSENDKAYTVRAEVPGVTKEDIKVSVDHNHVTISAEMKKQKETREGEKVLRRECYSGSAYRSFVFDQDVNEGEIKAKYDNGVLMLTLPKKAGGTARQIPVN